MAHSCPICNSYCTCNGDWDDIELSLPKDVINCICCIEDDNFGDEEEIDDNEYD